MWKKEQEEGAAEQTQQEWHATSIYDAHRNTSDTLYYKYADGHRRNDDAYHHRYRNHDSKPHRVVAKFYYGREENGGSENHKCKIVYK